MKYFPVLFLSLLILLSACAVNTLGMKTVKVTDYGPAVDGGSHLIAFSSSDSSVEYFYYTLDGEDPGKSSSLYIPQMMECADLHYHEGILVEEGKTIKVYGAGEKEGKALTFMNTTKVEETSSSLHESAPVIRKLGTLSYNSRKCIVNIESSSTSPIYYTTTAGTSPVRSGIKYTESEYENAEGKKCSGIVVDYDETIKAVTRSDSGSYSYISSRYLYSLSTPTIKDVGESRDGYRVYSMTADDGAAVYYTTNGSDPRKYGIKYIINSYGDLQGMAFPEGSTLCVVAGKDGKYSSVLSFLVSELVSFAPKCDNKGTQDGKAVISLSSNDASLPIYYTLDGTDPREEGRKYVPSSFSDGVTGISVDAGTKIRAVTKKGDLYSNETTFTVDSTEELGVDQSSPLEPNVEQGEEFEEKEGIETTPIENDRPFNIDYDTPNEDGNDSTGSEYER